MVVVGVGGGGSHALSEVQRCMSPKTGWRVSFVCCDADAARRDRVENAEQIPLDSESIRGRGCGGQPALGREAAFLAVPQLQRAFRSASLLVVFAGLGGGAASGATPVILETARNMEIPALAVVTMPFRFEGNTRSKVAMEALQNLRRTGATLVVIPNDEVSGSSGGSLSVVKAMEKATKRVVSPLLAVLDSTWEPFDDWAHVLRPVGPMVAGTAEGATARVEVPYPSFVERAEVWKWRLLRHDSHWEDLPRRLETGTSMARSWINRLTASPSLSVACVTLAGGTCIKDAAYSLLQLPAVQALWGKSRKASLVVVTSLLDVGAVEKAVDEVRLALDYGGHLDAVVVWNPEAPPAVTMTLYLGQDQVPEASQEPSDPSVPSDETLLSLTQDPSDEQSPQ